MDRCRSCNARILWALTTKGRRMPIDPEPVQGGNIELEDRGRMFPPLATFPVKVDNMTTKRYTSHFATCPNANAHRKKHVPKKLHE